MTSNEPALGPGGGAHLSELRLVLLGSRGSGKTSTGRTILSKEELEPSMVTVQCETMQGEVEGKRLVLVDTPGWLPLLPPLDTSELYKCEIERSASLCPPGPHCLLLVVPLNDRFTRDHTIAVREHLKLLFGELAWRYTLVLFTHGDLLENTPIQEVIQNGGKALQSLIKTCQERYHVLDNIKTGNRKQVTELLGKIEEMVKDNHGSHHELRKERIDKLQLKRETDEIEGEKRRKKVQRTREDIRAQIVQSPQKLRLVVMGYQYSGKSSTGNTILGNNAFSLNRTVRFATGNAEVSGRWQVTVVDTPGRWRIRPLKYTSELFKQEIMLGPSQCPPGPHAVLLVLPTNTSFTDINWKALQEHLELLGENVWSHVLLLFSHGDWLGRTPVEQFIESEGVALKRLVEKCRNRYHVFNNKQRNDGRQVTELLEKIEEMVQENGGSHFEMDQKKLNEVKETRRICVEDGEKRRMRSDSIRLNMSVCTDPSESLDSGMNTRSGSFEFIRPVFQLVLLGYRRAGQTSSANSILDMEEFGYGPLSQCVMRSRQLTTDRCISVVCTLGWEKTERSFNTPHQNKQIVSSVDLCSPGPHVFLLVLRASMSFCAKTLQAMEEHVELLGKDVWDYTMLLFTYGDRLGDTTIEQHIESEGEALKKLVERCGNRYYVLDNYNRDGDSQVTKLLEKIEEMVIANRGHCFQVDRERLKETEKRWETEREAEEYNEDQEVEELMGLRERLWGLRDKLSKWLRKTSLSVKNEFQR